MGKTSNGASNAATSQTKARIGIINRLIPLALCDAHERNYNKHSDAQIADLRESLRQFGQVRSIVVQAHKHAKRFTIVAGEGISTAARLEGFKELRADVIPASWSKARVLAYLAADNELARHGDPDQDQLAAIVRDVMEAEGEALAQLAAGEKRALDALLKRANGNENTPPPNLKEQWMILIECENETEQADLLERFSQEGMKCRALIS